MRKLKPIENLEGNVRKGDLVRFRLKVREGIELDYVGYCHGNEDAGLVKGKGLSIGDSFPRGFLFHETILDLHEKKLQVGAQYGRRYPILGYEILERAMK